MNIVYLYDPLLVYYIEPYANLMGGGGKQVMKYIKMPSNSETMSSTSYIYIYCATHRLYLTIQVTYANRSNWLSFSWLTCHQDGNQRWTGKRINSDNDQVSGSKTQKCIGNEKNSGSLIQLNTLIGEYKLKDRAKHLYLNVQTFPWWYNGLLCQFEIFNSNL